MLSLVVAMDKNGLIGKDNGLPWKLKADLQWFKTITVGKRIIMGRKTWESLGCKPLPNRKTFVLRQNPQENQISDFDTLYDQSKPTFLKGDESLFEFLGMGTDEYMIVGGRQVYEAALPWVKRMYVTEIDGEYEGDTYFPEYDKDAFQTLSTWKMSEGDVKFAIKVLERK
jgi:dihydrofolate reductase